jgi:hypothetical protein
METILETNFPKNFPRFSCESCGIKTNNKKDYNNHLLTAKHIKLTTVNKLLTEFPPISPNMSHNKIFICEICDKEYKSRVGLWKHKKKCCNNQEINIEENSEKNSIN